MREAGGPSTGSYVGMLCVVRGPPGVVMVSPPEGPRNAEGVQSEGPGETP
jgi:hypothetical protein